jgi:DNA-binding CsgD family transcriptional regulator
MQAELIDRIYESSVVPELWPAVLDDLAALSGSRGGLLFSARKALHWTASGTVRDVFEEYVATGWFTKCSRRVCLMSETQPTFFVEHDFWSEEDLARDPIYRDFFRPRGLGWSAGTGLRMPTGDNIVVSVERELDRGPIEREHVEQLNAFRPHLARSAFVSARLGLQRARGATEALTALQLPALLIDEKGVVIEANPMSEALPDLVKFGAQNRLVLTDRRAGEMLAAALEALGTGEPAPHSFPVRDAENKPALVAHVVPIRRSAHDIFASSYAILLLTPLGGARAPSAELMRSLFDLTASVARIATGLATGQSLAEVAAASAVTVETARSYLRRVLEKTGCHRQGELVALMATITRAGT